MNLKSPKIVSFLFYVVAISLVFLTFHHLTARVNESEARAKQAREAAVASRALATANAKTSDQALTAVSQLAAQVRRLGGHPVVEPSKLPPFVVGPQGIQGLIGLTGANGKNGSNGSTGATGPQGPPGPEGPAGPAGQDGSNGTNGASGAPGATGSAGYPESFTIDSDGAPAFVCSDPDGDHNYTCEPATPTPSPTP